MTTMRAMRRLRADPVPRELVRELIAAALCAPSAGHQQGQVFIVVTDRDRIARLATVWRMVAEIYEGWMGKADPRYGTDPVYIRTWEAIHYQRDHFHETPLVIVACYDQRRQIGVVKRRLGEMVTALRMAGPRRAARLLLGGLSALEHRSEAASIYPAIQNLLLAARARGLAANMTTWHLFAEADVKEILEIPSGVRTYAVVPIGWPLGRFGPVTRRPPDEAIREDHW
ncbi:MAG: nitroreductase [Chloroflexi bacterium]|nr:MAG: nitroreductase [Chloroflexota bacterium]TMC30332.1 MAG: nitroreductase [Chloroflexota bacterium]TMC34598.1 MAG: nitroreductase [Chloroflexota bacterium]TMC56736.1 MAG: nitroreductase [Chloroflexota bacterium]